MEFKIAPPESLYIIGRNSIDGNGDLYIININTINKESNKRNKSFFDVLSSTLIFLLIPVLIFYVRQPKRLLINVLSVFFGKKSWVGYYNINSENLSDLPSIKQGILHPMDAFSGQEFDLENIRKINHLYSKDYDVYNDFLILLKGIKEIGRN